LRVPGAADVLERAAFLEYCGGYERAAADRLALGEYGRDSWEALALALAPVAPGEGSLVRDQQELSTLGKTFRHFSRE
jgi:hypothetical protein